MASSLEMRQSSKNMQRGSDPSTLSGTASPMVRWATREDIAPLARVLARAFDQDPFFHWIVPQDARRAARLERAFVVLLRRLSANLSETYTTSGREGAVVWKRPGNYKLPLSLQLRLLPAFLRVLRWARIPALLRLLAQLEQLHEELVPAPHFYLLTIGVSPDARRHGWGSRLLSPVLSLCDREGKRAYLECSSADYLDFYAHHGFEVAHVVERTGWPELWLMIREPHARNGAARRDSGIRLRSG